MARSDDDDALDWGDGSDDPTYLGAPRADRPRGGRATAGVAEGSPAADAAADTDDDDYDDDDDYVDDYDDDDDDDPRGAGQSAEAAPASSGSALLVVYGVFAGVYLLYVIGWIIGVQRDPFTSQNLFFEIMYQLGEFFAILSPVLWFSLTLLLTRHRAAVVRLVWLVLGMIVVAPLPFLLGGSAS